MKKLTKFVSLISLIVLIMLTITSPLMGKAQDETPLADTATVAPLETAVDTPEPQLQFTRPLVVISSYDYGVDQVTPGNDFNLKIRLKNNGESDAYNMVVTFESTDFLPLASGGVRAVPHLDTGASVEIDQPMRANASLWGYSSGAITANVAYTDEKGASYTERFTLTIDLRIPVYSTAQPTAPPRYRHEHNWLLEGMRWMSLHCNPGLFLIFRWIFVI
jgi:hypothetical protein